MKNFDLGQAIGILANIGVISGIIFLAFELRQNTLATQLIAAESYVGSAIAQNYAIATNAQLAETLSRDRGGGEITAGERTQLRNLIAAHLRVWESTYYQYSQGALDEAMWSAYSRTSIRNLSEYPRFHEYWADASNGFTPEFRQYVESVVALSGKGTQ